MKIEIQGLKQAPGLYLVATPIGNLNDISIRALECLNNVDVIYCEDTRQTKKLLNAYNIKTKTAIYHDHSSEAVREKIIKEIAEEAKSIALVSDAGMPLISDPGFKLVQALRNENIPVTSIPGANAVLTALQLSGLPTDPFTFLGFLPAKEQARKKELQKWEQTPATLVFYESKQRVLKTLQNISELYGQRHISVVRELTKKFEEVISGSVNEVMEDIESRDELKGEIVVIVAPYAAEKYTQEQLHKDIMKQLKDGIPLKKISENISLQSGWSKKDIYNEALKLKDQ